MYRCFLAKGLILLIWGAPSSDICITSQLILVWSDHVNCFLPSLFLWSPLTNKQNKNLAPHFRFLLPFHAVLFLSAAIKDTIFLYSAVILLRSDRQQTSRPYRIFSLFQLLFFFFISLIWSPAATHPSPSLQMYFFNHTPLHWGYIIITVSIKEFAR